MTRRPRQGRRRFIKGASAFIVAGIAGCTEDGGDGGDTDPQDSDGDGVADSEDDFPNDSTRSDSGPAAVLERLFIAADAGDTDSVNRSILDESADSDLQYLSNGGEASVDITSIENHSLEEAANTAPTMMDGGDTSVEEIETFGDELATEFGQSDSEWTLIYYDAELNGAREENYSWVVETEGGWKVGFLAMFGP